MIDWKISSALVPYEEAVQEMAQRVDRIHHNTAPEMVWLLEHPSLFTMGSSSQGDKDLIDVKDTPVYETGRGGKITYHGPGQRIAYVMLNLKKRKPDVRAYVRNLEEWVIQTLDHFGLKAERRPNRIGLWVETDGTEKKIAAIGVRLQKWVSFHGIALNVAPDLSYFSQIIPCGIKNYGVTSMEELGVKVSLEDVDAVLREKFMEVFGT